MRQTPTARPRSGAVRLPLAIFLLLAGLYLLSTGGHTYASDEEQMLGAAVGVARHGSFALNAGTGEPPRYSSYGPGQSLLAVPLVWAGDALAAALPPHAAEWALRAAVSWLNPLVSAAAAALIALAGLRLGFAPGPAAAAALLYGLATMAWPHSKTFFAEPLASVLSFAGFALALPGRDKGRELEDVPALRWTLAGLCAGLACAVKIQAGLALPFLGLWALYSGGMLPATDKRWSVAGALRSGLLWGLGALLGLAMLGLYQWALFGSPLRSGYGGASGVFSNPLHEGLYGLLLSPGKGLLLYAPPLLLMPVGLALLWRRDAGAAALCGAVSLATLLFYSLVIFWHGDGAWGPRYLNMALPFMCLPLVAVAEAARKARGLRVALALTCLLAVPVQAGGVLISLNAYLGVQRDAQRRYYEPAQSPILGHLRLAATQVAELFNLHLAPASLALVDGFSYSEGDREAGELLPRWTLPTAGLELRPPAAGRVRLELELSGCLPAPLPPATVSLAVAGEDLAELAACPPRRAALLLPAEPARIELRAPGWSPAAAGIDRDGPLGLYLTRAAAWADGQPLALRGDPLPVPPMPAGPVALRQWSSDHRVGHWDLWAWYLAHAGLPAAAAWSIGLAWAGAAALLAATGAALLRRGSIRRQQPIDAPESPSSAPSAPLR